MTDEYVPATDFNGAIGGGVENTEAVVTSKGSELKNSILGMFYIYIYLFR
jgi:hypothetical protein